MSADTEPAAENATDPPGTGGTAKANGGPGKATRTKADKPPRKRGGARPGAGRPSAASKVDGEVKQIEAALAEILSVPAIPCGIGGHAWAAEHFTTTGPAFAGQLAETAKTSPGLRKMLLAVCAGDGFGYGMLAIGAFGYAVPPLLYFATPADHPLRRRMGIPPRPDQIRSTVEDPLAEPASRPTPAGPAAPLADSQPG